MDAHSVLVAARNLIDREGWVQAAMKYEGGFCLVGACRSVEGLALSLDDNEYDTWEHADPAAVAVREALGLDCGDALWAWNDERGRTKAEVLDLFDRAIAATAPPPPFGSVTTEPATAREPINESVFA